MWYELPEPHKKNYKILQKDAQKVKNPYANFYLHRTSNYIFGFTLNEIQDQMRRIKVLEEKLKKSFFTDIVSLKEVIKKEYTETILDSKAKEKKNDYELKDMKEKTANELIKTLITENIKIIQKE